MPLTDNNIFLIIFIILYLLKKVNFSFGNARKKKTIAENDKEIIYNEDILKENNM